MEGNAEDIDDLVIRGSRLYVAMTRARDRLDLSYAGDVSLLVDALVDHVDLDSGAA